MNFIVAPSKEREKNDFIREALALRQALSLCSSVAPAHERFEAQFFESVRVLVMRLISGGSGLGKTFLLRSMANRLIEHDQNVLIVSAYTFLQLARKSFFEGDSGMKELTDVPVLMLDDLGSEPLMQNITIEQLYFLVNERQNRGLSTIISTNLTLPELRERYTERIVSRMTDPKHCIVLTLAGQDLRKLDRKKP